LFKIKACDKNNRMHIIDIQRIIILSITQRLVPLRRIGQKDHLWMDTNYGVEITCR
jgi:hypothetical protein